MIKKYSYEELERVTDPNGSRYYVSPIGEKLSSVTTILSATSYNPGLDNWKAWVGEKEANRVVTEACNLGSLMHTHLENHVMGVERPRGSNLIRTLARNMADQIINKGLGDVDEVWGMEEMLYFPSLYAGTADLIGVHKGQPAIMDYKTSRKMKKREMIDDYFCQLSAYAIAHNELYGTEINKGVIFMADRDLNYQEFIIEGDEMVLYRDKWLKRLEIFLTNKLSPL